MAVSGYLTSGASHLRSTPTSSRPAWTWPILESHGDIVNQEYKERKFRERVWTWTQRGDVTLTMAEYVEESISLYRMDKGLPLDQGTIQNHRARATRLAWRIVKDAIEERRRPAEERRLHILRRLHPQLAIRAAIEAVERGSWTTGG